MADKILEQFLIDSKDVTYFTLQFKETREARIVKPKSQSLVPTGPKS